VHIYFIAIVGPCKSAARALVVHKLPFVHSNGMLRVREGVFIFVIIFIIIIIAPTSCTHRHTVSTETANRLATNPERREMINCRPNWCTLAPSFWLPNGRPLHASSSLASLISWHLVTKCCFGSLASVFCLCFSLSFCLSCLSGTRFGRVAKLHKQNWTSARAPAYLGRALCAWAQKPPEKRAKSAHFSPAVSLSPCNEPNKPHQTSKTTPERDPESCKKKCPPLYTASFVPAAFHFSTIFLSLAPQTEVRTARGDPHLRATENKAQQGWRPGVCWLASQTCVYDIFHTFTN